jgi:RNA-binding protein
VSLTGKQKRKLRAMGHHLSPVVYVGQGGVTPSVIAAAEQALFDHELIKVKINEGPDDRHTAAEKLAAQTEAELAQLLGRTALLFKKRKEKSKIDL